MAVYAVAERGELAVIDARLDRWAVWRRSANRLGAETTQSPLAKMQAEGSEIERGSRHVKQVQADARRIYAVMLARYRLHKRMLATQGDAHPDAAYHTQQAERLRKLLWKVARTTSNMAWASLISGTGYRPGKDYPDEERTQSAIMRLADHLRDAIEEQWLSPLPMDIKARQMGISERTLRTRVRQAQWALKEMFDLRSGKA